MKKKVLRCIVKNKLIIIFLVILFLFISIIVSAQDDSSDISYNSTLSTDMSDLIIYESINDENNQSIDKPVDTSIITSDAESENIEISNDESIDNDNSLIEDNSNLDISNNDSSIEPSIDESNESPAENSDESINNNSEDMSNISNDIIDESLSISDDLSLNDSIDESISESRDESTLIDSSSDSEISKEESTTSIPKRYYFLNSSTNGNGTVKFDRNSATKGTRIIVTVLPEEGYVLEYILFNEKKITEIGEKYAFSMPNCNVTVKAIFAKKTETSDT